MYEEKTIVCKDCGKEFIWSVEEQEFFAERGLKFEPQRCNDCRKEKRAKRRAARKLPPVDAVCSKCGKAFQVHFTPDKNRPVYCKKCFKQVRAEAEKESA